MSSYDLITYNTSTLRQKRLTSLGLQLDVNSIRVGTSNLEILEASGHFNVSNKRITNAADPVNPQDLVTKNYADAIAAGFDPKESMRAATVSNLSVTASGSGVGKTLTATANGAISIDGVALGLNDRLMVKNQTIGSDNGFYSVTAIGTVGVPYVLTRTSDFDGSPANEVSSGAFAYVTLGAVNSGSSYVLITDNPIVIDTTALVFTQSGGTIPDATSASGGGVKGRVTFDSDKGLAVLSGVAAAKVDNSTVAFDGSGNLSVKSSGITATQLATDAVTSIKIIADAVTTVKILDAAVTSPKLDYSVARTNDNTSAITTSQIIYLKANGNVDLAIATGVYDAGTDFGYVQDPSIAAAGSGKVVFQKGKLISGFTGLTVGSAVFLSRSASGGVVQNLTGFVATNSVVRVGFAESATSLRFDPVFVFEY